MGARLESIFETDDADFLASLGCTRQELFDFVEDSINWGDVEYDQVEGDCAAAGSFRQPLGSQPADSVIDPAPSRPRRTKSMASLGYPV